MRKKHEWIKVKHSRALEAKEDELKLLKTQITEKDKEVKLFELKLKEL